MEKKELNKLLNMIAKYKYFTDEKRDKIFSYLEEYKEKEPFYYHKNIGRICALFGPLDMAITHLNTAKELDETNPSVYYELYKCHIKNNDFESALDNLTACIKADGGVHNFELPIMMLRSLVDMDLDSSGMDSLDILRLVQENISYYFDDFRQKLS